MRVQHHHAHIVACMAENGHLSPVIGLACDGVGLGEDNAVWGCEVMRVEPARYTRLGHLRYVPLLGGDAAAVQTARPALAVLWDTYGHEMLEMPLAKHLAGTRNDLESAVQLLETGVNCPPHSSLGRWFDAVAGLCGVAAENAYEGQAPMHLEAAMVRGVENHYDFALTAGDPFQVDLRPAVREMVNDLSGGYNVGVVASRFHNTVARFLLACAERAREMTGLHTVALSGGCFANRFLAAELYALLITEGFEVLRHIDLPCNDGCVSVGQAVVAAARLG